MALKGEAKTKYMREYMRRKRHGEGPAPITKRHGLGERQKGLLTVSMAEAAEKQYLRAKDLKALNKAVEAKIDAQADYVVWRDSQVKPSHEAPPHSGIDGPGTDIIAIWRKKLTVNIAPAGEQRNTKRDPGKIAAAKEEAKERCRQACEHVETSTTKASREP